MVLHLYKRSEPTSIVPPGPKNVQLPKIVPIERREDQASRVRTYQFHAASELKRIPGREWGAHKLVYTKGTSLFIGDGGSGKTTFVRDLCIARAIGQDFLGRPVKPAVVWWVAAESIEDMYPGLVASLACYGVSIEDVPQFRVFDGRMPFNNEADVNIFIDEMQEQINELQVPDEYGTHFVFDTYARCTPGADENSTQETKVIVDAMQQISIAFNAQVTTIHHFNAQGKIRGNTALRDGVDIVWEVTKDGSSMKFHCNKMKGNAEPEDFHVEMRSIMVDQARPDDTAPVIFLTDTTSSEAFTPRIEMDMLDLLQAAGQLTSNTWAQQSEKTYGISERTFHNHRKHLLKIGLVEIVGGEKPQKGKRVYYMLSEAGNELLKATAT